MSSGNGAADMERLARDFALRGDFGPESLRANEALMARDPNATGVRTRLGRCYEQARRVGDAVRQYEAALAANPDDTVARNGLSRARLRLHFPGLTIPLKLPSTAPAWFRGFPLVDFAELATVTTSEEAVERFQARFDDLGRQLNGLPVVSSIQEARRQPGGLFHSKSLWGQTGHLYTYHWGGRWEAQCNVGMYSANSSVGKNLVRVGVGFNVTMAGRDPDAARKHPMVLRRLTAVQQSLTGSLGQEMRSWLEAPGWALQFGDEPPMPASPANAVERFSAVRNPTDMGWFFIGRWMSPNDQTDAHTLGDARAFLAAADAVFRQLLPILRAAA